jgi:hypothetical protein
MRFFKKKSDSPDHQEYLDGLITSIRKARRQEEEKPGLHAFIEEDDFPVAGEPGPPRVPPGVANAGSVPATPEAEESEEIANLEAYLSRLTAADAAREAEEEESEDSGSGFD